MITTLVLEPGNVNVTELDLDADLNVVASRPIDRVFRNIRLAAMPKRGEFPQLIIVEGGRPLTMDRPVTQIRTKKRHKPTFDGKAKTRSDARKSVALPPPERAAAGSADVLNRPQSAPAQRPSKSDATAMDGRAEHDEAVGPANPQSEIRNPQSPDSRPRIKILTCSDAAAAAGFRAGDIVPVESFGRGYAFVKPAQGYGPDIIITNAESQPVAQEDAA